MEKDPPKKSSGKGGFYRKKGKYFRKDPIRPSLSDQERVTKSTPTNDAKVQPDLTFVIKSSSINTSGMPTCVDNYFSQLKTGNDAYKFLKSNEANSLQKEEQSIRLKQSKLNSQEKILIKQQNKLSNLQETINQNQEYLMIQQMALYIECKKFTSKVNEFNKNHAFSSEEDNVDILDPKHQAKRIKIAKDVQDFDENTKM